MPTFVVLGPIYLLCKLYTYLIRGVARIWEGGQDFFSDLEICMSRSDTSRHAAHGEAMRFARGVRGHAPPRNLFKMVQFDAFWCVF